MKSKTIRDILTVEEIDSIRNRLYSGVDHNCVLGSFKKMSKFKKDIIINFIEKQLQLIVKNEKVMGNKNEPYYESEDDMIIPKYTWNDLSKTEKEFYKSFNNK